MEAFPNAFTYMVRKLLVTKPESHLAFSTEHWRTSEVELLGHRALQGSRRAVGAVHTVVTQLPSRQRGALLVTILCL